MEALRPRDAGAKFEAYVGVVDAPNGAVDKGAGEVVVVARGAAVVEGCEGKERTLEAQSVAEG